ncbi:MAG TPA: hypothetical protein VEK57_12225, partial [Thermoanaerobaculia bacterium]|nr:hypothetical protein [Thermoanaerobaculia bacterium]
MPEDFHLLRTELRAAREETSKAAETLFLARERLARVVSRQQALARFGKDDPAHAGELKHLELMQQSALQAIAEAEQNLGAASKFEQLKAEPLAPITDPREAMQFLDGRVPLLLMPVRLETRFRPAQSPPELWVRVYPDDCSVDTFEPTFSDDELQSTREYWAALWQAGRDADQERGAWRRLAEAHGPGRAEWLVDHHAAADVKTIPEVAGTRPKKNAPADVILTIVSEEPVPDDFNVVANYWFQLWNADGDRAKEENARKHLDFNAGDPARVEHILRFYRPSNFDAKLAWPLRRNDVDLVGVSFLSFPAVPDRRRHAWGRPAKVTTLPDRFVFIGINEGQEPHVVLGNPIPATLHVGPDPAAPKQQQLRPTDDRQDLVFPDEMKWLVEFDRAVDAGMGFRVNLQDANATGGFDRVLVCGVRVTDSAEEGQARLQTLIEHHRFSRAGFALIPQGSPTNNTDTGPAGYSRTADADESFDRRAKGDLFEHEPSWLKKSDGEWLAEYLGIDPEVVRRVAHAGGTDQSEARAMNTALWPATFGYWMQSMMAPVIDSDPVVALTRDFFTSFVIGRGAVPAVRIGRQPYGILPATALSHMEWLINIPLSGEPGNSGDILRRLHSVLSAMDADWEALRAGVAHAGKEGDPHKTLLDIVGLHAGSAELRQRWAESAEALYQTVSLFGIDFPLQPFAAETWNALAMLLLYNLGYTERPVQPELLSKFFLDKVNPIDFIVDEVPLSESDSLQVTRADKRNYIEWLIAAGKTSLGHLYTQEGFGSQAPKALLYVMLRHALQLGYHDVSLRLHVKKELLPADEAAGARIDVPFLHIGQSTKSRYEYLFKHEPLITNTPDLRIDEFIAASLESLDLAHPLRDQLEALEHLKKASTARLERAFLEHLDCCTYRLDAWLLGLVHLQLTTMRRMKDEPDPPAEVKRGIYLGAYAWLENLRPEQKILTPFTPPDDDVKHAFQDGPPLVRDSANLGYIHAPSLNQAVAAAVLRNGYKQSASPENRKSLAVNLTSERVRAAMAMIEGIRAGQSLGALLGYQFERGLHDRYGEVEMDSFLYELRAAFPLAGNKLASTKEEPVGGIREIEARNVIDGLALVNHVDQTGLKLYPFGKPELPDASPGQAAAIDAEVERLRDTCDAVADVAMAEGVYQTVIGNYDRTASTYDAFSKGTLPPEPQVVRTPAGGRGLTHRVALHLDPAALPVATPRSMAEPPLNAWLGAVLPPLGTIGCRVTFLHALTNKTESKTVTLAHLGVSARDVLELVHDGRQAMNELDDRVVRFVTGSGAVRPDGRVTIEYRDSGGTALPLFEVMPLIRHLRTLIEGARPLRPTDLTLSLETAQAQDEAMTIDFAAVDGARKALASVRKALAEFAPAPKIDQTIDVLATILSSAALFGIPQTGWG